MEDRSSWRHRLRVFLRDPRLEVDDELRYPPEQSGRCIGRGVPICVIVMISTACGGGEPPGAAFDHDAADVAIIENGRVDPERSLLADPTRTLQIGVADGNEEYQLSGSMT